MNPRITDVRVVGPWVIELSFTDGSTGTVDLEPWIRGRAGIFVPLQDPSYFAEVAVDREAGTICWPNGVDLDPDMLYDAARRAGVSGGSAPPGV